MGGGKCRRIVVDAPTTLPPLLPSLVVDDLIFSMPMPVATSSSAVFFKQKNLTDDDFLLDAPLLFVVTFFCAVPVLLLKVVLARNVVVVVPVHVVNIIAYCFCFVKQR